MNLFYLVCVSFGLMLGSFVGEKHALSCTGIFILFLVAYAISTLRGGKI